MNRDLKLVRDQILNASHSLRKAIEANTENESPEDLEIWKAFNRELEVLAAEFGMSLSAIVK